MSNYSRIFIRSYVKALVKRLMSMIVERALPFDYQLSCTIIDYHYSVTIIQFELVQILHDSR